MMRPKNHRKENNGKNLDEFMKIRVLYKLKNIDRISSVGKRKESSAEHSWSCMILADYLLNNTKRKIDKLRVYELLMYHDVVEIYAGDSPLSPELNHPHQAKLELASMKKISKEIPSEIKKGFVSCVEEFEECRTIEAKFARAVDALDAIIHELDYKKDWKGWSKNFLRMKKSKYFYDFPELNEIFEELLIYQEKNGYFDQ